MTTYIRSTLGAGPHEVVRIDNDDGTFTIKLTAGPHEAVRIDNVDGTFTIKLTAGIVGHGNTRREAAKHLADQLRELARLVDGIEGSP